jgi:hypothetical protein
MYEGVGETTDPGRIGYTLAAGRKVAVGSVRNTHVHDYTLTVNYAALEWAEAGP